MIFFQWCNCLDYMVTKQLSHIRANWEIEWNHEQKCYDPETDSYAEMINDLIVELSLIKPPKKYHDTEDHLAELCKAKLNWNIQKVKGRWEGGDYISILEQGGFYDINENLLCLAVCGRIKAALSRGQMHFDDMEEFHRKIIADLLATILYHRDK